MVSSDEMNIHIPQTLEAQAELKYLSSAQHKIITAQSSKPLTVIVQDSLLGSYRMTLEGDKITKSQFYDISCKLDISTSVVLDKIQHIRRVLKDKGKKVQCFNGKGLISLFLPEDLIYEKKNNASSTEPVVKIYKGVLYEGVLDKNIIGSTHNSLIHVIFKEYGCDAAAEFINNMQFVTNSWLLIKGFSVGLEDCMISDITKEAEIKSVVDKCIMEAEAIKTNTTHPGIREMRINSALNKARDVGLKIAKDALKQDNNFLSTVRSGSKGDFFNIAQITGLLGQQNLKGQRMPLLLNNGKRTLVHYPFENMSPEQEYESRGFISSSFIKGLNPRELYFHSIAGREGISDTALGTALSGYMQRRIIKLTEDIKVMYDGSIRDVNNRIYQVAYNDIGVDPTMTVRVGNEQSICDVGRLVDKLNLQHIESKKKK
jgi:DNA-directed RNA polymerase beta' subunit